MCMRYEKVKLAVCWHYRIFGYCRSDYQVAKRKAKSPTLELSWEQPPEGSSLPLFSFSSFYAVAVVVEGSKSQQVQVWASLKAPLPIHRPKGELAGLKWRDMGASWASPIPAKSYCLRLPVRCSEEDPTIIKDMPKPLLQPPSPHPSLKVQPHNLRGCMEVVMRIIEVHYRFLMHFQSQKLWKSLENFGIFLVLNSLILTWFLERKFKYEMELFIFLRNRSFDVHMSCAQCLKLT